MRYAIGFRYDVSRLVSFEEFVEEDGHREKRVDNENELIDDYMDINFCNAKIGKVNASGIEFSTELNRS